MKHFKLVGPETTREFDIEDDEMIISYIIKMKDFDSKTRQQIQTRDDTINEQNVKIYDTKEQN